MTNEELKKKIKEILRKRMTELLGSCHTEEIPLTEEGAEAILFYADEFADALIAAGIGDVKEAEHRALVSERAVYNMAYGEWQREGARRAICEKYAPSTARDYLDRAEKELTEERKDD